MRFEKNNQYFTLSVYIFLTSIAVVATTLCIFNFKEVFQYVLKLIRYLLKLISPLIIGGIIAYLLDPIVEFYEKRCIGAKPHLFKITFFQRGFKKQSSGEGQNKSYLRTVPTLLTVFTLIALIGLFVLVVVMNFRNVLGSGAIDNLSASVNRYIAYFTNMLDSVTHYTDNMRFFMNNRDLLDEAYHYFNQFVSRFSEGAFRFITVLGANSVNIGLAFVIAFYLLQDKKRILLLLRKIFKSVLPESVYRNAKTLVGDIDYVFSNYIRGQMIDAVIIALLTSFALTLVKMDFAIIIGLIAGLFNLIPYFGPIVGYLLAGLIGLIGPDPMKAVYGVAALMIIQQIDGWIIVPKVLGDSVKLHPIIVLLSILIGGKLFGLLGMLLGVPIAGFIRLVIIRYAGELFEAK